MPAPKVKAGFIEPMLLLPTSTLPEGEAWGYELKLNGYRAIAFKTGGRDTFAHETTRISTGVSGDCAGPKCLARRDGG
jgi:hypothetical protein